MYFSPTGIEIKHLQPPTHRIFSIKSKTSLLLSKSMPHLGRCSCDLTTTPFRRKPFTLLMLLIKKIVHSRPYCHSTPWYQITLNHRFSPSKTQKSLSTQCNSNSKIAHQHTPPDSSCAKSTHDRNWNHGSTPTIVLVSHRWTTHVLLHTTHVLTKQNSTEN